MDACERTLAEYRRVLDMMQGIADTELPLASPDCIATLAWAIGVLEHEAARKEEKDDDN